MFEEIKKFHLISNFPEGYPFYKKILANLTYFLTGIVIHPRRNLLTHGDLIKARVKLREGDIALWGNLREVSSLLIRGPLTHASIYLGRKTFIEAVGTGVRYVSLHHMFTEYDTLAIMRIPRQVKKRRKIIKDAIMYAKSQIGKPYDFDFSKGSGKLFCTELVNYAYQKANYDTKLKTFGRFGEEGLEILEKIITAARALHPVRFVERGNFEVVFLSHNLRMKKKLYLK